MAAVRQGAVEFRLLGPFEAARQGEVIALGGAKQRALLARLLLSANEVVPRDRLIDDLWGEDEPKDAAHTIQVFVSQLRKALGRETIETRAPGYLVRATEDELDVLRFETLRASGREALEEGRALLAEETLAEALALFRGPPLADFTYQAWAQREIARLKEARVACHEDVIEARLALGRPRELVGELEALIASHPLRERLRGQLMLALYREGRQAEALECYQHTRALLDEQLGIEPAAELKELHRRILNQDPTLTPAALPDATRTTLPTPATAFLGRARELAEVKALLGRADVRLLTLTGPGGTGKTRLAIQAASELAPSYPDGVFWVPLASLSDPELVLSSVSGALESKQDLAERIGDKRLLLVLDNFEQVVEAAPDVAELLSSCPRLDLLVTSRESLHLSGEQAYPVPPLEGGDGVELFLTRARALQPSFEANGAVGELCSRLDNLPLAIELAAARSSLFTPQQLISRLSERLDLFKGARDADPRQQTLRSTIAWSYELLSDEERMLFARLAVFAGGCTYEAAEQVAGADPDLLQSLIDKSLVRHSDGRYWMLETIREFAAERLTAMGHAEESRERHADWMLRLAHDAGAELRSATAARWLARLDHEQENLRACLAWLQETRRFEAQLAVVEDVGLFWDSRGLYHEGLRWSEAALERTKEVRSRIRATVLQDAAALAVQIGDVERSRELAQEGLVLSRELGDLAGVARASLNFGFSALMADDDHLEGERLLREAAEKAKEANEPRLAAWAIGSLADVALRQQDFDRAIELAEEAIASFRRLEIEEGVGFGLCNLALALFRDERDDAAFSAAREALSIGQRLGDVLTVTISLLVLGSLARRRAEPKLATRLLGAADRLREQTGYNFPEVEATLWQETADELCASLGEEYESTFAEGRSLSVGDAVELALARSSLL